MKSDNENFMVGDISVSPQHNMMTKGDQSCRIQPKVMAVLHYLASNKERVINNEELLDTVWQGRVVTNSSIQKCINSLRSAFAELDGNFEYVVYFSKRGYQLVTPEPEIKPQVETEIAPSETGPEQESKPAQSEAQTPSQPSSTPEVTKQNSNKLALISTVLICLLIGAYWLYGTSINKLSLSSPAGNIHYTQVKPFASNTGRETFIEPHTHSERVAFIRNEFEPSSATPISQLYVQSPNGKEWALSSARGEFVYLAWSASGRNLVAIDAHINNEQNNNSAPTGYFTFHIYTLDFKAEKVIEKNLLSHWHGFVSSVVWQDENTLEFVGNQAGQSENKRFRYQVAEQNLSLVALPNTTEKLKKTLPAHLQQIAIADDVTATLSYQSANSLVQVLDQQQNLIWQWSTPQQIKSITWLNDHQELLLLSENNQLLVLNAAGKVAELNYFPKAEQPILMARSQFEGKKLILTVAPAFAQTAVPNEPSTTEQTIADDSDAVSAQLEILPHSGGFIYSQPALSQ